MAESIVVGQWLARWGTTRRIRAKGQHATVVERHHEILRQSLHKVGSQLKEEGINVPCSVQLAEAVLAKNVIQSIHGHGPYRAL
eukprot:13632111-Heterocapsa_arctica.AAC.1